MSEAVALPSIWSGASLKSRPLAYVGRCLVMFLRYFNGVFYFAAGIHKFGLGWMWSDALKKVFEQRVTQLPADSFAVAFLQNFAIPLHIPVAWVLTSLELASGAALLLGFATRWGALLAVFTNFLIGIGGYYDASLIALTALLAPVILTPSGLWAGLDRKYHARYPTAIWFK